MIKRLLIIAKPWWGSLLVTVLALIGSSPLNLVTPEAVRRLTALLAEPEKLTTGILLTYVGIMVGAYLLRGVFRFLAMWQSHVGAWNFVGHLTSLCYDKLQSLSMRYYSDKQTGEIMSRMINDTRQLEVLIAHSLPDMAMNIIVILGVAVMIFTINPALAAFTLLPVPFIIILSRIFITKVAPLFKINQEVLAGLNARTQDNLSGMKEIQAFGKEGTESLGMKEYCKKYIYVNVRANFYNAMCLPWAAPCPQPISWGSSCICLCSTAPCPLLPDWLRIFRWQVPVETGFWNCWTPKARSKKPRMQKICPKAAAASLLKT